MNILGIIFLLLSLLLSTLPLSAKGVPAGTKISSVATLSYTLGRSDHNMTSNTVVDVVGQVLELKIVCQESSPIIVQSGESDRVLTFKLSNIGNGTDSFVLTQESNSTSGFTVSDPAIFIDSDNNGIFNRTVDRQIDELNLTADTNTTLFFVSEIPKEEIASGSLSANGIKARSVIGGSGSPGKAVELDDYFAMDGIRGGIDSDQCMYEMFVLDVILKKSATLSSDKLYTGTTIHYRIDVQLSGEGTAEEIVVRDNIPSGTHYLPDSLKLNGKEAGSFDGKTVKVAIGSMTQTAKSRPVHRVTFDVVVD